MSRSQHLGCCPYNCSKSSSTRSAPFPGISELCLPSAALLRACIQSPALPPRRRKTWRPGHETEFYLTTGLLWETRNEAGKRVWQWIFLSPRFDSLDWSPLFSAPTVSELLQLPSLFLFAAVSLSFPNWFAHIFCCFCTAYPSQNQAYLPISLLEQSVYSLCQGENESMEWEACDDSKSSALKHWSKYKVVFAWALHRCYQGQNTVHL